MGRLTFQKRQKEMKRKEKRQAKDDKRAAKKLMKIDPTQEHLATELKVEGHAISKTEETPFKTSTGPQ